MKNLLRGGLACMLIAGMLTLSQTGVDAQTKGKAKDTKGSVTATGTIEVYKGKKGFRYRIKNAEGKTVAMPLPQAAYETRDECLKAIEDLKAILNGGKIVDGADTVKE
ncbi:MAG: hypothetical protein R3B84_04600 [Zavarzinella sp.]